MMKPWLLFCVGIGALSAGAEDALSPAAFQDPPLSARPRAYWDWINGAVSIPQLTRDLEEMKAKGMGGGQMWDSGAHRNQDNFVPPGPPFLGPESVDAIHHSLREAKRLGLELGLLTSSGWNAGGAWVTPEMAGKNVYVSEIVVQGAARIDQVLPFPSVPENCPKGADSLPLYSKEVAVLALPEREDKRIERLEDIQDLTSRTTGGRLQWEAPQGKWRVLRFVCTNNGQQLIVPSPNSKGLLIDFLDPAATTMHFQYILDKLSITPQNAKEWGLAFLAIESMELEEGIQWTDGFRDDFVHWKHYDPTPYLPLLAGWKLQDDDLMQRFLYDYHQAVSEQLIFSHYTTGRELLSQYGIALAGEAGGPGPPIWNTCPVDALKALGNIDIPQGEFWIRHRNMFLVKEIASASHIYGKGLVDAESFTTWRRWKDGPQVLKLAVDRAFCEGLNRITYHGFAHSPDEAGYPGRAYHAGVDLNPRVTWWEQSRPFFDYLARCCYMLQQGQFVADVAYYYGDQAPNFWPEYHDVPEKPLLEGLGRGYDYDVINSDVILNRLTVKDGVLTLPDGMSYRMLVLRDQSRMPLEVLQKIAALVQEGATILGPQPTSVPGLHDYQEKNRKLKALAEEVWGDCDGQSVKEHAYGKGRVLCGQESAQVLRAQGILPDFLGLSAPLDYIHRKVEGTDLYLVRNPSAETFRDMTAFRVPTRQATLWDPRSGKIYATEAVATDAKDVVMLPLLLPPGGALFVVFGADVPTAVAQEEPFPAGDSKGAVELAGPWTVHFPQGWGAPDEATFASLSSWSEREEEGIKYFSGTATYTKILEIPQEIAQSGTRSYIDLGLVRDIARVRINGRDLGVVWTPPYLAEMSGAVQAGANTIEIDVTNMWINRLTGDQLLPKDQRFLRTNIPPPPRDIGGDEMWHVEPAGLLGPVRILWR